MTLPVPLFGSRSFGLYITDSSGWGLDKIRKKKLQIEHTLSPLPYLP